jgi:hypothetical protein
VRGQGEVHKKEGRDPGLLARAEAERLTRMKHQRVSDADQGEAAGARFRDQALDLPGRSTRRMGELPSGSFASDTVITSDTVIMT